MRLLDEEFAFAQVLGKFKILYPERGRASRGDLDVSQGAGARAASLREDLALLADPRLPLKTPNATL